MIVGPQLIGNGGCKKAFQWFCTNLSIVPVIWIVVACDSRNILLDDNPIEDVVVSIDADPDMNNATIT